MKISVRGLLLAVACLAFALGAIRSGGVLAGVMIAGIGVFVTALLIVVLVARDGRRVRAIGFLVPFCMYVGVHYASPGNESDIFNSARFASSRSLQPLFLAIRSTVWVDYHTGLQVTDFDPAAEPERIYDGLVVPRAGMVTEESVPDPVVFGLTSHLLAAVCLGLVGSKFALYIHNARDDASK